MDPQIAASFEAWRESRYVVVQGSRGEEGDGLWARSD